MQAIQENNRIKSLDITRGIIMILMALDHCRYFMHGYNSSPEDLRTTTVALFFTRWITHFCAPGFIFLVGIAAYLYAQKKGPGATRRFLSTRGLLLIFLELTLFRFAWDGSLSSPIINLLVIWAIGMSMLFLALMIRIKSLPFLFFLSILIIAGHNMLDGIHYDPSHFAGKIWIFLHAPDGFKLTDKLSVFVLYSLLPYFGIVLLGWCTGYIFGPEFNSQKRKKILLLAGLSFIIIFVVLRYFNLYGDPGKWSTQKSPTFTFLSFIKTTKYPTSLLYILMTLGPILLLLCAMDNKKLRFLQPLLVIGQVPMFFYILHLFVIRMVALIGGGFHIYSLAGVYGGWVLTVCILYVLCLYYRDYKFKHPESRWLKYV
jgi:uncharacterized membrane protein